MSKAVNPPDLLRGGSIVVYRWVAANELTKVRLGVAGRIGRRLDLTAQSARGFS